MTCLGAVWNHRHQESLMCFNKYSLSHTVLSAEGRAVSKVRNGFPSCSLVKKQDACQLNINKWEFFYSEKCNRREVSDT